MSQYLNIFFTKTELEIEYFNFLLFFSNRRWGQPLEPLLKSSFRTIARTTKEPTNLNTISQTNANLKQNNPNQTSTASSTTPVPTETTPVPKKTTTTQKTTTTTQTTTPVPIKTTTVSIETTAVPVKTTTTQKTTTLSIKTSTVPIKTTTTQKTTTSKKTYPIPIKTTTVPIETTTTPKTTTIRLLPKFKNFKDKFGNLKPKRPQGIFETKKISSTTTSTTSLPKIFKNRFNFKLRKNQGSTGYFY